jgi:hypothetical protein
MLRFLSVSVMLSCLVLPSASARSPQGNFTLASSDVQHEQRDADGRILERTRTTYNEAGVHTATDITTFRYRGRHVAQVTWAQFDADQVLLRQRLTRYKRHADGTTDRVMRRWTNADGELTRRELDVWERDTQADIVLITTRVWNGEEAHIETRYTIHTYRSGRLLTTDTSIFDAEGVQKSRNYTEWARTRVERWQFDSRDEVLRHTIERHTRDARGRDVGVTADVFDGNNVLLESRVERFVRDNRGRTRSHVVTWFDAEGLGTRRSTTSTSYSGPHAVPTRRVLWERWESMAPTVGR